MSDFFKQLINQLQSIWVRLNLTQRVIILSAFVVTLTGLVTMIAWNTVNTSETGEYTTLFHNLEPEDAAQVTDVIKKMGIPYKFENAGSTLLVEKKNINEVRMEMARNGLPKQGHQGYELFDKLQLGMTDFVQNLNFQRALEGEITNTIETLEEVEKARVHIKIPKPTLFKEKKEEATASVVVKLKPGKELDARQVKGITHLVSSSVEGLVARQVAVVDIHGNLLTKGFADNALAEQADHNQALQHAVEAHLEKKVETMFEGLLGPGMVHVKVNAELDFDQVDKQIETYTPTSKVVRSQQREDGTIENSPAVGNEQKENSITNYEIDRTMAKIVNAPGTRKRITVSVAVDGRYRKGKNEERVYQARSEDELGKYEQLVKNIVGFREGSEDKVFVASMEFDRQFYLEQGEEIRELEKKEQVEYWGKIGLVLAIILFAFLFLRGLAKSIAQAMNPPVPQYAQIEIAPEEEEIPETLKRQNELLERLEIITREHPASVASLIKNWLREAPASDNQTKKKKK